MRSIVAAIQPPEMRECSGRRREEDFSEQSGLLQRGQEYTGSQNAHITRRSLWPVAGTMAE